VAHGFQQRLTGTVQFASEPLLERVAAAGWCVWFYLYKVFLPIDLSLVYPRWDVAAHGLVAWLPGLALVGLFAIAWRYRATWGAAVALGLGADVVALLPVLGLVGVGFMVHSRVADHWQYTALPSIIALAVASIASLVARPRVNRGGTRQSATGRPRVALALALAAGVLCFLLTWRRAGQYVNEETLYRDTLEKNSQAWIVHANLGQRLALQGRFDEAVEELQAAVQLEPRFADAFVNLGNALDDAGRPAEAETAYLQALRLRPEDPELHFNLGIALQQQERLAEAANHYAAAVRLQPSDVEARRQLATVLRQQGRLREEAEQLRTVLRLEPADAQAAGRLAWVLATSPEAGSAEEAIALATSVSAATNNRDPGALDILAAAYARAGRLEDAIATARDAMSRAQALGDTTLTTRIASRLQEYETRSGQ
jgi:tetratricopeptide (TPR) repeat protein